MSYAHEDEKRIEPLAKAFEKQSFSVFGDRRIPAGQTWRSYIGQALINARCVIVVWSQHSVVSKWVFEEAEDGRKRGILVPVLLDSVEAPFGFRSLRAADLTNWQPEWPATRFKQLIQGINAVLRGAPTPPATGHRSPRTSAPSYCPSHCVFAKKNMRILYGVQTTGNGHISCSREVIRELKTMGHEVRVLLSGRKRSLLWDMDVFEPFMAFPGLSFVAHRGKIKYFKTVCKSNFFKFYRDIASFDVTAYDVVITDYEPITAWIARKHAIPSIGVGHHYAFYYKIPMAGGNVLTRYILLNFAPVDYPLGLHWYHFNQPILPPIVPDSLKSNTAIVKEKILVYLPFEQQEEVESTLRPLNKHHFFIYSYVNQPTDKENIHVRPYSRSGFLRDLAECNGVICSAGFGLVSEALHLGKKLLIKPLLGQIEQLSNALVISELELGSITKKLDCDLISNWLDYSAKVPMSYPNVARIIAHWIEDGCWEDMDSPVREAWNHSQIDFKRLQL